MKINYYNSSQSPEILEKQGKEIQSKYINAQLREKVDAYLKQQISRFGTSFDKEVFLKYLTDEKLKYLTDEKQWDLGSMIYNGVQERVRATLDDDCLFEDCIALPFEVFNKLQDDLIKQEDTQTENLTDFFIKTKSQVTEATQTTLKQEFELYQSAWLKMGLICNELERLKEHEEANFQGTSDIVDINLSIRKDLSSIEMHVKRVIAVDEDIVKAKLADIALLSKFELQKKISKKVIEGVIHIPVFNNSDWKETLEQTYLQCSAAKTVFDNFDECVSSLHCLPQVLKPYLAENGTYDLEFDPLDYPNKLCISSKDFLASKTLELFKILEIRLPSDVSCYLSNSWLVLSMQVTADVLRSFITTLEQPISKYGDANPPLARHAASWFNTAQIPTDQKIRENIPGAERIRLDSYDTLCLVCQTKADCDRILLQLKPICKVKLADYPQHTIEFVNQTKEDIHKVLRWLVKSGVSTTPQPQLSRTLH